MQDRPWIKLEECTRIPIRKIKNNDVVEITHTYTCPCNMGWYEPGEQIYYQKLYAVKFDLTVSNPEVISFTYYNGATLIVKDIKMLIKYLKPFKRGYYENYKCKCYTKI